MATYLRERRHNSRAQKRTPHTVNWVLHYGRGGVQSMCARVLVNNLVTCVVYCLRVHGVA